MKILTTSFAILSFTICLNFFLKDQHYEANINENTFILAEKKSIESPPDQIKKAKEIIARVSREQVAGVDAKNTYKLFCSPCHGKDGDLEINGSKDLSKSSMNLEETVARIYFGEGFMTAFKGLMSEEEIVAVAEYLELTFRGKE